MAELKIKVIFIGIFNCWSKHLTLIFKVRDQGHHFCISFKYNLKMRINILFLSLGNV